MNVTAGIMDSSTLAIVIQSVIHQIQEFNLPLISVGMISDDVLNLIGKRESDLILQQNWYLTLGKGFTHLSQFNYGKGVEIEVEEIRHTIFVYYMNIDDIISRN